MIALASSLWAGQDDLVKVRLLERAAPQRLSIQANHENTLVRLVGGSLRIKNKSLKQADFDGKIEISGRRYRGHLTVQVAPDGASLMPILTCSMDDYVLGVTGSEIDEGRDQAAYVRALAATIRRYAELQRGRHAQDGHDFCDYTHCQRFAGLPLDEEKLKSMLAGLKPWAQGQGFFSRTCGGALESETNIWGHENLPAKRCELDGQPLCAYDKFYRWQAKIPLKHWLKAASQACGQKVQSLEVLERTPAGRIRSFEVQTYGKPLSLPAGKFYSAFGKLYGWSELHSLWFEYKVEKNVVKVEGKGIGHGTGLCQSGALNFARQGWDEEKILDFYNLSP